MSLITIVTMNHLEGKNIQEILSNVETNKYRVHFEFLRPIQIPAKLEPHIDLLIYNNPMSLTMITQQQIASWRRGGFLSPILLLSKVPDLSMISSVEALSNTVLLEKPFEEKDMRGIVEKFLNMIQVAQRKYRRYATQQHVSINSYTSGFQSTTKVNNMSLGGLCLEGQVQELKVGDVLKINFSLDRLNVERVMNGRVVWVDPEQRSSAGVQFMKESEVYSHLLKEIG